MTDPSRMTAPPLAVITGAAKALAAGASPTDKLKALCEQLRVALPAAEVRLRAGERRADRPIGDTGGEAGGNIFAVTIPWRGERTALLEVTGAQRPPAELRPILETVAAMLATVLPVLAFPAVEPPPADDTDVVLRLNRLTIDSLPVGLYVVDRDYRVVLWNRKRETGTQGLRREDVLGKPIFEVLRRQSAATLRAVFDRVFTSGEVHTSEQEVHTGGEVRTYRTSRIPMRPDGTTISHVITIGEDVTETRAIQRVMHQTEKLAAVGQLAAGVMHEINNPLATIGGAVAAIGGRLKDATDPVIREYLGIIESEVSRCTNIIDGLLDFSHSGRASNILEPTDINTTLDRTLALLQHHQRFRRLRVQKEYGQDLPRVMGNAERLIQAAMAILLNAADATGGNGEVTLRTRFDGHDVVAEFGDNGPGIPPDILPKIFDPFFTTKGPSRGTGLGLAICYGIVADHQGHLDVRSEPGHGTVFLMALPTVKPVPQP